MVDMTYTTIHLLRHGEVDNPDGVLYGRMQGFGLTPLGRQMAVRVAQFLVGSGADITHVIASPLLRAQETALPTALAYDLPIETDPRLIEAGSHLEGVQIHRNPKVLAYPRNWKYYMRPLEPSWGEPYSQIGDRMARAVASALHEAKGHEALLVSHQLPVVMVQRTLERQRLAHSPRNRQCSLASLTSLLFDGDELIGWQYEEPAGDLLKEAQDMSPGSSVAAPKK